MPKRFILPGLVLLTACLAACGPQLEARFAAGDAIVVYPDDKGTVVWQLDGEDYTLTANSRNVGAGYRAAALKPGRYTLTAVRNVYPRSTYGFGDKDLDFGERERSRNRGKGELAQAGSLPTALVDRPPIKELRTNEAFNDYTIDVSSEYRMLLRFDAGAAAPASFEVRQGEVLLMPLLRGELTVDERSCARRGDSASPFNNYDNPYLVYVLSDNPEDFTTVRWQCPVKRLVLVKPAPGLEQARAALDSGKISPELVDKMRARDLDLGPLLRGAAAPERRTDGGVTFSFDGP